MAVNYNPFHSHRFTQQNSSIELYHVYDNCSRTPYTEHGLLSGEERGTSPRHAITPRKIRNHLNWRNRRPTQFISFYDNFEAASIERDRRLTLHWIDPDSVEIAVVVIQAASRVWLFNRAELMRMMGTFAGDHSDIFQNMSREEWLVWGDVPSSCVFDIL